MSPSPRPEGCGQVLSPGSHRELHPERKLGDSLEETDGRQPDVSAVLGLKMEKRWP